MAAVVGGRTRGALVAGDIAMLEPEVNSVIKTLRQNNLEVVALHNHMIGDQPRIIFLRYFGHGAADKFAQGFSAVLNEPGKRTASLP